MGRLDEPTFETAVKGCPRCGGTAVDIQSFIDRRVEVMLSEPNDDGAWVHDGEKFVDGTYRITCVGCAHEIFADDMCPRCHAEHALGRGLDEPTRLEVPKRCPSCNETELRVLALIPATARYAGGRAALPEPRADYGDAGYHIVAFACESCDAATVTKTCPLCDAPGPLRVRP